MMISDDEFDPGPPDADIHSYIYHSCLSDWSYIQWSILICLLVESKLIQVLLVYKAQVIFGYLSHLTYVI